MGIETLHIVVKFFNTPRESEMINPFHTTAPFLYLLKTFSVFFLLFSGGIERYQWHETGYKRNMNFALFFSRIKSLKLETLKI